MNMVVTAAPVTKVAAGSLKKTTPATKEAVPATTPTPTAKARSEVQTVRPRAAMMRTVMVAPISMPMEDVDAAGGDGDNEDEDGARDSDDPMDDEQDGPAGGIAAHRRPARQPWPAQPGNSPHAKACHSS